MWNRFVYNLLISFEAISQNRLRALLTSLGIVFGVSSVIAMLGIGSGAQQEIIEKLQVLGTNNIIVKRLTKDDKMETGEESNENQNGSLENETLQKKYSPDLSISDAKSIVDIIEYAENFSYEVEYDSYNTNNVKRIDTKIIGIDSRYFELNSINFMGGRSFSEIDHNKGLSVCIVGHKLAKSLFPIKEPLGQQVKIGGVWHTIIGIVGRKSASEELGNLPGVRNINSDVFLPHSTFKLHYVRRDVVTKRDLARGRRNNQKEENLAEVDKIIIRVNDTEKMPAVAEVIKKMLKRRHNGVEDFRVIVPELLLDQERSTKQIFNIVLSVIASISLVVGGIGIMNIMFSSVMERTKEIGIRRAVGATETDIQLQFIIEAVAISFSGGIIGIFLGLGMSGLIEKLTEIKTIVQLDSVLISFFVSIAVGLIFGITPAKKAAEQDPIKLLRYE